MHSELPGPPARARRPHHLTVGEPGHGLKVVPASQRLGLGVVHRHPVELVEAAGVVEVHVGSHSQQWPARRILFGPAVLQEAGGIQVLREAAQPQACVDHHVLLGAAHQPDVGAVARLIEAFLNPEDAVAQGLVGVPLKRRHAGQGCGQAEWVWACVPPAGCPDSGAAAVWSGLPAAREKPQSKEGAGDADRVAGRTRRRKDARRLCLQRPPAPSCQVRREQELLSSYRGAGTIAASLAVAQGSVNAGANAVDERSRK